jgi:phospholipid-translocating ATPase
MYNLAFTSLPIILMGVLDQDVDDKVSLANPQLYKRGIERKEWTQPKFWAYMIDGGYQSVLVFWCSYLLFWPANTVTHNGLDVGDVKRLGVFVACCAVVVVNLYVLFNTYRWDWLTLLIQAISILFFFFWTGVWTSSSSSYTVSYNFYRAAAECFGQLSFWLLLLVTVIICLLPRFTVKSAQKVFFPREVDIIREQVQQGKFDYLKDCDDLFAPKNNKAQEMDSSSSSASQPGRHRADSEAAMYPPSSRIPSHAHGLSSATSTAQTAVTQPQMAENRMSTENRLSVDALRQSVTASSADNRFSISPRPSIERTRTSFERSRRSMDRMRPSFEQSDHFTSAAMLTRMSSAGSVTGAQHKYHPSRGRGDTIGEEAVDQGTAEKK